MLQQNERVNSPGESIRQIYTAEIVLQEKISGRVIMHNAVFLGTEAISLDEVSK